MPSPILPPPYDVEPELDRWERVDLVIKLVIGVFLAIGAAAVYWS